MFEEERIESFLRAFSKGFPEYIEELEEKAKAADIPIIRKDTQELLRVLLSLKKPKKILEIGTAVGFSSLLMAEYTEDDCKITTIENYPPRIEEAKNNFSRFDKKGKINFLEGDAGEIIKNMQDEYDLIFLDGPKGQYENYLDDLLRMLPSGGLLITDNILKEGEIVESRFAVTRRNRTIHSRMREYLLRLRDEEILENVILPTGDGMTLSVKK